MKENIKSFLKKKGWFEYLLYSRLFESYQRLFKPELAKEKQTEISLYRLFLGNCQLIFDIGANYGQKTDAFLSISQKVVSVEPDPSNYRLLQIRFRRKKRRVICENVAVSDSSGEATFFIHRPGSALNTINDKWRTIVESAEKDIWGENISYSGKSVSIKTVTVEDLITKYGKPDFIKIDTEGSDIQVLLGLRQPIKFLSFEILLPEFRNELREGLRHLLRIDPTTVFNLVVDEKLLLPEFIGEEALLQYLDKNMNRGFEIVVKMQAA